MYLVCICISDPMALILQFYLTDIAKPKVRTHLAFVGRPLLWSYLFVNARNVQSKKICWEHIIRTLQIPYFCVYIYTCLLITLYPSLPQKCCCFGRLKTLYLILECRSSLQLCCIGERENGGKFKYKTQRIMSLVISILCKA